ncbi:MAG: SPOR domain-containing protein [Candidatus Zixiibacteriota bacterium]
MKHARSTYNWLVVLALAGLPLGCTFIKREPPIGEEKGEIASAPSSSYDPLSLAQDTIVVTHLESVTPPVDSSSPGPADSILTLTGSSRISGESFPGTGASSTQVFRVQLLTLNTFGEGRRALAVAEEIFDQPVVLDYEVPYYKLRVGQFSSRTAAENYLLRARTAGYPNSLVAACTIGIREAAAMYDPTPSTAKGNPVPGDGANAGRK